MGTLFRSHLDIYVGLFPFGVNPSSCLDSFYIVGIAALYRTRRFYRHVGGKV